MRITISVFLLGAAIICTLSSCSPKINASEEYADALKGEKEIQTPNGTMRINDLDDAEKILYCFSDVNGDGSDELIIRGRMYFYVVKSFGDEYKVIYTGNSYDKPIDLEKCHGIMYYRNEGAPFHEMYKFRLISSNIEGTEIINASWYDVDEDGVMDNTDYFFLDGYEEIKVTKDKWLSALRDYLPLKDIEVEWEKYIDLME